jgi:cbb3-type cytochrome oxidase subunit 1
MGIRFLKIAAVYLAIGVSMGLAMGITQNFSLHPVHAHINLLGWATMALAGLIYVQFPQAALTRLAKIHFWLHNLALPVMMVSLALLMSGYAQAVYFLEAGSTSMVAGIMMFVVNVCRNVRPEAQVRPRADRAPASRPLATVATAR